MQLDFTRHLDPAKCRTTIPELRKKYPKVTKDRFKLRDGGGLFLLVEPTNARGWRFNYRRPSTGKPNTISLGTFPEIGLADARTKCDGYRKLVAAGKDPSENKEELRRTAALDAASTVTFLAFTNFEIANEKGEIEFGPYWRFDYVDAKSRISGGAKTGDTLKRIQTDLRTLQETLGPRPIRDIKSGEILAILDRVTKKGNLNKAHRVQSLASRIFDLAVAREVCEYNVAAPCKKALATHIKKKRPAVTDQIEDIGLEETERRVGELLRRLRDVDARIIPRKALEFMALTFPRPLNIIQMRWDEIVGDLLGYRLVENENAEAA